jgi:xanthine dehydrogenase accessory factor
LIRYDELLTRAVELSSQGMAFALATVVRAEKPTSARLGANALITADGTLTGWVGGSCSQPTVIREAIKAMQDGEPRLLRLCPPERIGQLPQEGVIETVMMCASGGTLEIYIEPHVPRPQLVVIGHLPIAEALARLSGALGYEVTVMGWDATPDRFPTADRVFDHLDFTQIRSALHTYVVVASHGNYDEAALAGALKTNAAYIALVASKKRSAAIMEYLCEAGLSEQQLARVKYPAGLDIGAVTPDEIALSILAEIVQLRRRHQLVPADLLVPNESSSAEVAEAIDPVCSMTVTIATAHYTTEYAGQTYYFCSAGCQRSFEKEPDRYLVKE